MCNTPTEQSWDLFGRSTCDAPVLGDAYKASEIMAWWGWSCCGGQAALCSADDGDDHDHGGDDDDDDDDDHDHGGGTNSCSALAPCGAGGGDHCTAAGSPFRGYECNALSDNQPNAQPGTCRFNVIDPHSSGSCQDMCSTFGWDCVRFEEYNDNMCGAHFVASYDCDQPASTYTGHEGHAMCTCSPRGEGEDEHGSGSGDFSPQMCSDEETETHSQGPCDWAPCNENEHFECSTGNHCYAGNADLRCEGKDNGYRGVDLPADTWCWEGNLDFRCD
jgi:hypothetical protein